MGFAPIYIKFIAAFPRSGWQHKTYIMELISMNFNISGMFMGMIKFILFRLLVPVYVIICSIMFMYFSFLIYYKFKGYKKKKRETKSTYKKKSFIHRIFFKMPQQLAKDFYARDPDEFKEYGLHLFCGEQGSGKTTSTVELIQRLREQYPKLKCRSNINLGFEDGQITDWRSLVDNNNGIYGQIEFIDEIQAWFSSNQSKNFPPEMLAEISQQRKQRKMLIGTAQVFSRVAKPIREQVTFVYCPVTIAGVLTIVRVTKPQFWNPDKVCFKKYIRTYFFVHEDKIRNAFDTYKKVLSYKKTGFTIPVWQKGNIDE